MARIIQRGTFGGGGMQGGGGNPVMRARQALAQNNFGEAERLCRRRLERKPDDTMARLVLAQALLQLQQADEAAEHAQRVVDAQPNNADAQLTLSAALSQQQGNKAALARAESAARKASSLMPRSARPRVQLAEVALAQRKMKEAKAAADEAIKLEPQFAAAHLIRGVVLLQDSDAQGAVDATRQAIRYDRNLAPAHYTLALALNQLKKPDEAGQALDKAQELNAPIPPATLLGLRGQIYLKQRKYKQSAGAYTMAQRASGRPTFIAVPLGFLIVLFSAFGKWAPAVIAVVVLAILFGFSRIPVAGAWIVAAILLAIVGGMVFGYVRGVQSGALGLGRFFSTTGITIISVVIGVLMWGATFLAIIIPPSSGHPPRGDWTSPTGLGVGAAFGLIAAFYVWRSLLKVIRS